MCDYSLHYFPTRLAEESEQLCIHMFPTGSKGLVSVNDIQPKKLETELGWFGRLRAAFRNLIEIETPDRVEAVCIPPGAQLVMHDIPVATQRRFGIGDREDVTFVQLSATPFEHRDAIQFGNGRKSLLQDFSEGLRFQVVSLSLAEDAKVDQFEWERYASEESIALIVVR